MSVREIIASFDWVLTSALLLLVSVSLAMLLSTDQGDQLISPLFLRQSVSLALGATVYFLVSLFPYHLLRRYAVTIYLLGLVVMVAVSRLGSVIHGTVSRLEFMGVQIQPSEFMKVALAVVLAWLFAKFRPESRRPFVLSFLLVGLAAAIVVMEPDVGVATLMLLLWAGLIIFMGISWRTVVLLGLGGAAGFAAAWRWLFAAYQKARLITFVNPKGDPLGAGYSVTQSIIALGSGHVFGRGLGHGPQSQLKFLPERHTDFILASIGEELGFIGVMLVVILYVILLWRIMQIGRITRDAFGQYLAVGAFLLLLISFFVSAGMSMGLLPVTGIPLPLLSYGGSNLVSTLILIGIVQSVHLYSRWVKHPPEELVHF